ncbi:AbrB family transcriptional regulator [Pseudooceanicola sp. MF1-13]|uniref:AbrB family transcriptional regulator n=1 Tax=Pseudooceanicola sp. MF1-13 TaxID=3379095 RepID=UPI00389243DC
MTSALRISPTLIIVHLGLIIVGALGGLAARAVGLPLPFILGSLITVALAAQMAEIFDRTHPDRRRLVPKDFKFSDTFRAIFIGVVGMAIGTRITMDVLLNLPKAAFSFAALTAFVPIAFFLNYQIFRRIGGYDHATALFSGSPGGLYEAIMFGEQHDANMQQLMMAQFLRIILVVTLLPIGLSIYTGHPVGSAAGQGLAPADTGLEHLPLAAVVVLLGLYLGRLVHIPAPQLMGPLILGGIVTLSGVTSLDLPNWMLSVAQVIIGTALGTRFVGIRPMMLLRGAGLAVLSVGTMLLLGTLMVLVLVPLTGEHFDVMLISFAPGGVTEMALVALSLEANPAFVTVHHLYRIILTVIVVTWVAKRAF